MQYRKLGRTDIRVSAITMGCWAIAGDAMWGPQDEDAAIGAIRTALDAGINSFDTAEAYGGGRSEELVGKALLGRRADAVITSKVIPAHLRPADVRLACEASLRRLQTDYIDVYCIHWPNREIPFSETMGALEALKQEGKIRVIGCSNFASLDLADLLRAGRVEMDQLPYSLLWRAIEYEVLPACRRNGVSITCYSPLLHGILTGRFHTVADLPPERSRTRHFAGSRPMARHGEAGAESETFATLDAIRAICQREALPMAHVAMAWLMRREGVASVVAGARNPAQVRDNAVAADLRLSDNLVAELDRATDGLKARLGTNPDMWESPSRMR